jgi:hypothetical protein
MAPKMIYVSSNISRMCPLCTESLDGELFEHACNHVLEHGLKCLHVGQETKADGDGKPWHMTVAVFGPKKEVAMRGLPAAEARRGKKKPAKGE